MTLMAQTGHSAKLFSRPTSWLGPYSQVPLSHVAGGLMMAGRIFETTCNTLWLFNVALENRHGFSFLFLSK
jgi:hypothetical protein